MTSAASIARPADIIQTQIGQAAFTMLGAHSFTTDARGRSLRFQVRGSRKINTIVVTLDRTDTYTIEFWKNTPRTCDMVACVADIYADALRRTIETHTGLATSL